MTDKSVSFTPDEQFDDSVREAKRVSTIKDFFKNYEKEKQEQLQVGHAGLYWNEEGEAHLEDKDGTDTLLNATLELGASGKGKLLVLCEDGIANAVRELADDDYNHLPNTKTGIVVHYVTEGIARDFGITFDRQPVSLGGGRGKGASKNDREAGVIRLSKQEKNDILDKLDMSYYQPDIASGKITIQDAFSMIEENLKKKMEWESQGYYLSPNKTEGVLLYDWKQVVNSLWGDKCPNKDGAWLYGREKVEIVIPNVFENYYADNHKSANKKNAQHLLKSPLFSTVLNDAARFGIKNMGIAGTITGNYINGDDRKASTSTNAGDMRGGMSQVDEITSQKDILDLIGFDKKGTVMGVHLAKIKNPGQMKPRYVVVDVLDGKEQILYLYDTKGVLTLNR